jgi:hypothetical protein
MADRFGFQFTQSLTPETFLLDGYLAAGPDGYVDVSNGKDELPVWMKSIVRNSTGNYTVTLGYVNGATDTWNRILPVVTVVGAGSSSHLVAQLTQVTNSSFTFVLENSTTGTATDLPTNGALQLNVVAHNASVR